MFCVVTRTVWRDQDGVCLKKYAAIEIGVRIYKRDVDGLIVTLQRGLGCVHLAKRDAAI